ncbi:putative transmembrane protein, partial [Toxoplasma gondii FOU]
CVDRDPVVVHENARRVLDFSASFFSVFALLCRSIFHSILGLIGNRTARTPRAFWDLSQALCMRLETLQHFYALRQIRRGAAEAPERMQTEKPKALSKRGEEKEPIEQTSANIFTTVASALTLGDIITSLSSFNLRTHLYPFLEDAVCRTLEGVLFARKEALWFLIWIGFASAPNFTPKRLTLALREKMLDDSDSDVQNGLTEINHTVQKLGAFHAQRLLLPLQLMRVYDPEITRICIDTSLSRDRSSFKRLDSSLSLVFPLAYANALRPEFAAESLSAWDVNSARVFLHGNAFRGEYGRATMLAMLWSAAVANLHVQQTHVTSYLDKLFWCIDVPPPALDAWDAFRFSRLPGTGYLASFFSLFNPRACQVRPPPATSAAPSRVPVVSKVSPGAPLHAAAAPAELGRDEDAETSFAPPSFKEWHALDDIRQHDRLAIFQIREPLILLQQIAATYLADVPHAVRRSSKFPLIRAWANAAVDVRVDQDPSLLAIVQEAQGLLLSAGIRSRSFVPCSPEDDFARSRSSADKARDTVASWIGVRDASALSFASSSETDEALLACSAKTRTPQCVHLEFLDGRRPGETAWTRGKFEEKRFGLLVLGEKDGLKTLPSWRTTHFDTGVNLLRLRALKKRGWQIVTVNVHEWSEAQTPDNRLSLLLDKCETAGISLPFCVE